MLSFRDLFQEYIASNGEKRIKEIETYIKEKCEKNDYYVFDNFDLIYLYRQARFFNLQSELSTNENSPDYKRRQKKIVNFYSLIDLDNENLHCPHFEFNKKTNKIVFDSFINTLVKITIDNFRFALKLIDQMSLLFDTESLLTYSHLYILTKKLKKQPVEEIFIIILESWFNNVQIDELSTTLIDYAKNNIIQTTPELREKYYSFFNKLNYEHHYLTHKSQCFLLLANECSSIFANSTFFDFSIVSLQYYKIIETEIKQKIFLPCAKNIKNDSCFFTNGIKIRRNETKFNFLSLEKIETIFSLACDGYDYGYSDETRDFFESLLKICNFDIEYIEYFRDITSNNFRNKYRNPPAHTEPLNSEQLKEMVTIYESFIENMRKIHEKTTDSPTRPKIIDDILNEPKRKNYQY